MRKWSAGSALQLLDALRSAPTRGVAARQLNLLHTAQHLVQVGGKNAPPEPRVRPRPNPWPSCRCWLEASRAGIQSNW